MIEHICQGGDFEGDSDWLDIYEYNTYTTYSKKYHTHDYLRTISFRLFLTN